MNRKQFIDILTNELEDKEQPPIMWYTHAISVIQNAIDVVTNQPREHTPSDEIFTRMMAGIKLVSVLNNISTGSDIRRYAYGIYEKYLENKSYSNEIVRKFYNVAHELGLVDVSILNSDDQLILGNVYIALVRNINDVIYSKYAEMYDIEFGDMMPLEQRANRW